MGAEKRTGFTLIEMMVMVAVTLLLVSMFLPSLSKEQFMDKTAVNMMNHKNIMTAFWVYSCDYQDMTPPSALPVGAVSGEEGMIGLPGPLSAAGRNMWRCEEFVDAGVSQYMFKRHVATLDNGPKMWGTGSLYESGYMETLKAFYPRGDAYTKKYSEYLMDQYVCPKNEVMPDKAGTWVWKDWPEIGSSENRGQVPYSYFRPSLPLIPKGGTLTRRLDRLSSYPIFMDHLFDWDSMPNQTMQGSPAGIMTGYGDGHVMFRSDKKLFDEDELIASCGRDPWNQKNITRGEDIPGHDPQRFLEIYLLLCDIDPKSIKASEYMLNNEIYTHCWK